MARTSDPIDAVGAVVREALVNPPNYRAARVAAVAPTVVESPDGGLDSGRPYLRTNPAQRGAVEIQVTVKLSDFIAALTPVEAAELKPGGPVAVGFAVGFTDDDGNLVNSGDVPAYIEAVGLSRIGVSGTQFRALVARVTGRDATDLTGQV